MPLTDAQKNLLYEIYEVSFSQTTVLTGGSGSSLLPTSFDVVLGVKQQLEAAIAAIDMQESQCVRIGEILDEYTNWDLDFSSIDREGYSLRPQRNLRRVRQALFAYTGILFRTSRDNQIPLG